MAPCRAVWIRWATVLVLAVCAQPAQATPPASTQMLSMSDALDGDAVASGIAVDGPYAIVVSPDADHGTAVGTLYAFERGSSGWVETQVITALDLGLLRIESAISMSGTTTAFIGNASSGIGDSAYVIDRTGSTWSTTPVEVATAGDNVHDVALSGDDLLVGAQGLSEPGPADPQIFTRSAGVWSLAATLTATGPAIEREGHAVAIDGDTALVGAPRSNGPIQGSESGAVVVFERTAGVWSQVAILRASDGSPSEFFGSDVDIDGSVLVVGKPNIIFAPQNAGAAYVFRKIGGVWSEEARLDADDPHAFAYLGTSVAISGNRVLAGAEWYDSPQGVNAGAVYVFEREAGSWSQRVRLEPDAVATNQNFGSSVALSGHHALVGAPKAPLVSSPPSPGYAIAYDLNIQAVPGLTPWLLAGLAIALVTSAMIASTGVRRRG